MRREVFALVVFCTFMEDGCKWKGEVRHLEVCDDDAEKKQNKTKQNRQTKNRCRGFNRATLLIRFTLALTFPKPDRFSNHGPSDYVKGVVVSL